MKKPQYNLKSADFFKNKQQPEMVVKEFNMIEDTYFPESKNIDTIKIFNEIPGSTLLLASVAGVLAVSALGTFLMV